MHRKQLFIALLLLPLLSAAAGRHSSAPLPAAGTAAGHAAAGERTQTGELTAAARLDGNGGQAETEGGTATGEFANAGEADPTAVDTVIVVDKVQVTAIKQGMVLRSQPVAAAIVGSRAIERGHVDALKNLSQHVPNFYVPAYGSRMTSSIYVRGLGARIDQPVMGLNIDNVPVLNKDNYDMELADAERIEVLRGPQSTLYGRNTMGGVINVYTLSPLAYEGVRLSAEYGSGDSYRFRASSYYRINPDLGMAVTGYYTHTGGFFENLATGEKCDWERMGGGRWKAQWRNRAGLRIDNTLSFSVLEQGGYPYAYVGEEIVHNGQTVIRPGEIRYNDPCSYRRTTLSDGLTVRYDAGSFSVDSITSYQYSDDRMTLDQDFLPESYFTLTQAKQDHGLTEDIVVRSRGEGRYGWLVGAFGFYRHRSMQAPVLFKEDGLERLIADKAEQYTGLRPHFASDRMALDSDFRNPTWGAALYHESQLRLGRFDLSAGLRIDYERTRLCYLSSTDIDCTFGDGRITPFTERGTLHKSFVQLLPKAAAVYRIDDGNSLYASVAKGYKAGGFNTQMFSEVLQNSVMERMGGYWDRHYDIDRVVAYKPEKSWNFEVGSHFAFADGRIRGEATLFYILCRDQQLTVFPEGQTTGRMMTNAGRTRSRGGELSVQALVARRLDLRLSYGFTHATFAEFRSGNADYAGKRIPYAPRHTAAAVAEYTVSVGRSWLDGIVLSVDGRGVGPIEWNEANSLRQKFYALAGCAIRFEQRHGSLSLWCRNLTQTRYDVFYFESIGNAFLQRGRPREWGVTLTINLQHNER